MKLNYEKMKKKKKNPEIPTSLDLLNLFLWKTNQPQRCIRVISYISSK